MQFSTSPNTGLATFLLLYPCVTASRSSSSIKELNHETESISKAAFLQNRRWITIQHVKTINLCIITNLVEVFGKIA